MVNQMVPDNDEWVKGGWLAGKDSDLDPLLSTATCWITMQRYEAAYQLVWACVNKFSDIEERGNDGSSWEDFDDRADTLLLKALDHFHNSWDSLDLVLHTEEMQAMQSNADAYGYTFFATSLPKLKSLAESRQG